MSVSILISCVVTDWLDAIKLSSSWFLRIIHFSLKKLLSKGNFLLKSLLAQCQNVDLTEICWMNKLLVTFFTCYAKKSYVISLDPYETFLVFLYCILSIPTRFEDRRLKWFFNKYLCTIYHSHVSLDYKIIYVIFRIFLISNKESTCNRHVPNLYEMSQCLMLLNAKTTMTLPILTPQ